MKKDDVPTFNPDHLLTKSKESFLLAIEIFNKPTIGYKVEAFSFLLINAWELMLKYSIIQKDGPSHIYYKESERTLSAEDCICKIFNENNKIRKNLEKIIEIRNYATHLIIPEFNHLFEPLFQAAVFNYLAYLSDVLCDDSFSKTNFNPLILNSSICNEAAIKEVYGDSPLNTYSIWKSNIVDLIGNMKGDDDFSQMFIPVNHSLAFVKNSSIADITAYYDNKGQAFKEIRVAKDVNTSHPYGFKELKDKLSQDCPSVKFHPNLLTEIRNRHNVEANPEYYYCVKKNGTKLYSESFYRLLLNILKKS